MILGYRIGNVAYLTDCSGVPDESLKKLMGLELLIISALRYIEHPAHFNIEQAVEMAQKINPKLAVLTHMGHEVDYDTLLSELPDNIVPAYDGMEVELDEL
jgi:phosphoribosyl 1,2-cyclic phosphate phosphodiesterase